MAKNSKHSNTTVDELLEELQLKRDRLDQYIDEQKEIADELLTTSRRLLRKVYSHIQDLDMLEVLNPNQMATLLRCASELTNAGTLARERSLGIQQLADMLKDQI